MKFKFKKILSIILVACIISLILPASSAYATENNHTLSDDELKQLFDELDITPPSQLTADKFLQWLFMQRGALTNGDIKTILDNDDWFKSNFTKNNLKGALTKTPTGLQLSKDYMNGLLSSLERSVQSKYHYTYMHTVPASAFVSSLFTLSGGFAYDVYKDAVRTSKSGFMLVHTQSGASGAKADIIDLPKSNECVLIKGSTGSNGTTSYSLYNLNGITLKNKQPFIYGNINPLSSNYETFDNCTRTYSYDIYGYDFNGFSILSRTNASNVMSNYRFFVTKNGVKIPFFESLSDFTNYQMDKGW